MAIVLAIIAWSPMFERSAVQVDLPPIVVSGPPYLEPAFPALTGRFTPWEPVLGLTRDCGRTPTHCFTSILRCANGTKPRALSDEPAFEFSGLSLLLA